MPGNHNEIEKRLWDAADELRAINELSANPRRTRDLLLPKRISGEVDVAALEIETGD